MRLRSAVAFAGLLASFVLVNGEAHGDNVSIPLQCKTEWTACGPNGKDKCARSGPAITNDTHVTIQKGRRIRWFKTSTGPGNSTGDITLTKDFAPGDVDRSGGEYLWPATCKAERDKLRPDLSVKGGSVAASSIKVDIGNGDEWAAKNAIATVRVSACGATAVSQTVKSTPVDIGKGGHKNVTIPYASLPGGRATAIVAVSLQGPSAGDEVSGFNNTATFSSCACGGAPQCGANDGCSPGRHCSGGCCIVDPPS
jgi:hypothetical protein